MATVYLHIGTMKTGTSALQSFLDENRELLESQGYAYPRMELNLPGKYIFRNGHFLVYATDADSEKTMDVNTVLENGYEQIGRIAQKFNHIILSDEIIWHRSSREENFWLDVLENFRKIDCEVKVIVYLRRQDILAQSIYNQNVKTDQKTSKKFDEFLDGKFIKDFQLHYYEQLKTIERHIKKENIVVRIYEKGQLERDNGTIYSDFLKCIGLSFGGDYKIERPAANLGLQGNYIELKRIINGLPEYQELDDFMSIPMQAASAAKLCEKESLFSQENQMIFMEQFAEGNRKIAEEFLGRKDGILFQEPDRNRREWKLDTETVYQDILMLATETFCVQENRPYQLEERYADINTRIRSIESEIGGETGLRKQTESLHKSLIFRCYRKLRKIKGE